MVGIDYSNGYVERKAGGLCEGELTIEGITLSPIEGTYFKEDLQQYLWLKRKPILEYDEETMTYKKRQRQPKWEAYLKKCSDSSQVAYRGEFIFFKFCFTIVGIWDAVLGKDKQRLNFFIERMPTTQQTIINAINERKKRDD